MRDLNHELKQLCQRNRDGNYSTRHAREQALGLITASWSHDSTS
jgi:hypothetical protein